MGMIVVECMCHEIKCVCVVESMYVLWNASFGICYAFSCIMLCANLNDMNTSKIMLLLNSKL